MFFHAAITLILLVLLFRWRQKTLQVVFCIITMRSVARVNGKSLLRHLLLHHFHHLYLFQKIGWRLWMKQQVCVPNMFYVYFERSTSTSQGFHKVTGIHCGCVNSTLVLVNYTWLSCFSFHL